MLPKLLKLSFILRFFLAHGIHPERVMTDNGIEFTAFTSQKARKLISLKPCLKLLVLIILIPVLIILSLMEKSNASGEFFSRKCIVHLNFGQTFDTLSSELDGFLYRYNYLRRHGSLNYLTPLDRLLTVTELLK